ncbi:MAG: shikimate dehydrogenase, partial [Pseudomonadota bacterium]|nr:shikimate dehydrogenase [Pseudomonadota bacterium]
MRGQPLRAAVVGHPISHSQSPSIHGHWLEQSGIAGRYGLLDFEPEHFEREIRALVEQGYQGVNVTVPFKEAALALADEADATARRIGAANTLVFSDGRITARNTDAYGFWENLRPGLSDGVPDRAVVLGAGGAARAVLVALQDQGVGRIWLANRTLSRAQGLAAELAQGAQIEALDWDAAEDLLDQEAMPLIINTSSRGMKGEN